MADGGLHEKFKGLLCFDGDGGAKGDLAALEKNE